MSKYSKAFLTDCEVFAAATKSNIKIEHSGIHFTLRYTMNMSGFVSGTNLECAGLEFDEAERVFHAMFSEESKEGEK